MTKRFEGVDAFMDKLSQRALGESEFHQAVRELLQDVEPLIMEHPQYFELRIPERATEPDRIITFRVTWESDDGEINVNRGYRVQFKSAIGPFKGACGFSRASTRRF